MNEYRNTTMWLENQLRLARPIIKSSNRKSIKPELRNELYEALSLARPLIVSPGAPVTVFVDRMWTLVSYMLTMPMTNNIKRRLARLIAHRDQVLTASPDLVAVGFIDEIQALVSDPILPINHFTVILSTMLNTFRHDIPVDPITPTPGRLWLIERAIASLPCHPLDLAIVSISGERRCRICCTEVPLGDTVTSLAPLCAHWFHTNCLRLSLLSGNLNTDRNCPVCRRTLVDAEPASGSLF
ncbi:short chain oxidoreductase/dehydrogenase [Penicillium hispanicum]|uniref:short chain oxidoreductase/dehydrogenase n=1 Tax=Penicillium hispanicum TaxID=1080232 RepID=UPI00254090C5|nr:short chain oxidoreductase/dehydrogenase [Penicillium hispanicum]KAJ5585564.1 short chain oxidoreductase/dehydrogenase [Penicillium hispanicum]